MVYGTFRDVYLVLSIPYHYGRFPFRYCVFDMCVIYINNHLT